MSSHPPSFTLCTLVIHSVAKEERKKENLFDSLRGLGPTASKNHVHAMIAAYTMHRRHRFMVIDALSSSRLSVSKAWYTHTIVSLSTYCRSRCLVTSHRLHKP